MYVLCTCIDDYLDSLKSLVKLFWSFRKWLDMGSFMKVNEHGPVIENNLAIFM